MAKIGPNERCPCGSGLKFKKCCGGPGTSTASKPDRARALNRLAAFALDAAGDAANAEFWADIDGEAVDLGAREPESNACFEAWLLFDRRLADGRTPAEHLLAADAEMPAGERAWLTAMAGSAMRLYEIVDVRPGLSVSLQDVLDGARVTVNEKTFSRDAVLRDWVAARVSPRGPSGGPEIEFGLVGIPTLGRDAFRDELARRRAAFAGDARAFAKTTAPLFHAHWANAILNPTIPTLTNTDGEPMAWTTVEFVVDDVPALVAALAAEAALEADGEDQWVWLHQRTSLGSVALAKGRLTLQANSYPRARRGRALIEAAAGAAVRHVSTVTEDIERRVREGLRARARGERDPESEGAVPFEVQEPLILDHYEKHYHAWVDEPVPAVEGRTPRQAAGEPRLRPALVALLHELQGAYVRALKDRQPAYDASWMWAELGLTDPEGEAHPLPLAHERLAALVPGAVEAARELALRVRGRPGFVEGTTRVAEADLADDLAVQRITREHPDVGPLLATIANHELHRRKTFWVDPDLVWTLSHTELDVPGERVRAPFPRFAVVFTDRLALSRAERWLSRWQASPLSGQLLRVATVYVAEDGPGTLRMGVAADALGADVPPLHEVVVRLTPGQPASAALAELAAPIRELLGLVIQAILYATSVGVEPVLRQPPKSPASGSKAAPRLSSEEVYHLPGTIDITRLRSLHTLERSSEGRALLHRFLVRGHWRRPAANWADQRLRWIAPHWKGPPAASVVEHAYRLVP